MLAAAAVAAGVGCAACYAAAGPSLDFYLGCLAFSALICPVLVTVSIRSIHSWAMAAMIWLVFAVAWFAAGEKAEISVGQVAVCVTVLAGTIGVMTAVTRLLVRCGVPMFLASAAVTTGQCLWLTWPIWLSGSIAGEKPNLSVALHPLFVVNGVLKDLGIWTEQPIAYNLTTLGQDVQYRLPASAWPAIGAHAGTIAVLVVLTRIWPLGRSPRSEI